MRRIDLFLGFFKLGALAFGGTGPLSRAIIVDDRRWLDEAEFASLLGLCQALPGANTCNLAIMIGEKFCGPSGALAALAGLLLAPLAILVAVASFFTAMSGNADVRAALFGATAAGAGLAIGTAIKMAQKIPFDPVVLAIAGAIFAAVALFGLPLPAALAVLLPVSFIARRRQAMKDDLLVSLFLRFAGISLLAVGGATAALPEAHRQIVTQMHWLTPEQFAQTFAIAQTSPGPNVIVFSLFGWRLAGLAGLLAATLGILGPSSLLAYALARLMRRAGQASWLTRLKKALIPLAIGLMAANGYLLARGADSGALALFITLAAAAFVALSPRSPLWAMAAGAVLAVIAGRAGML